MNEKELLKYSMELSFLSHLREQGLITEQEYRKIKIKVMDEYKVVSDITAMTA